MTVLTKAEVEHLAETWSETHDTFMDAVFDALKVKEGEPPRFVPQYDLLLYIDAEHDEAQALVESIIDFANLGDDEDRVALGFFDDHDDEGDAARSGVTPDYMVVGNIATAHGIIPLTPCPHCDEASVTDENGCCIHCGADRTGEAT